MTRKEAIMCIVGALKGLSVSPDHREFGRQIIDAGIGALTVLGVEQHEIREAIKDAPFLSVTPLEGS